VSPLGDFSCLTSASKGSMTVQWALLHPRCPQDDRAIANPAELGIALHAPFNICRILFRQMAKYILPGEDNNFLAMHSTVSLSRVLALERGRQ
jgi:ribosomal protein S14